MAKVICVLHGISIIPDGPKSSLTNPPEYNNTNWPCLTALHKCLFYVIFIIFVSRDIISLNKETEMFTRDVTVYPSTINIHKNCYNGSIKFPHLLSGNILIRDKKLIIIHTKIKAQNNSICIKSLF